MTDFSAIATVLRRELLSGLRTTSSFMLLLGAVSIMMLAALMAIAGTGANAAFAGSRLQMLYVVQMGLYNLMVYLMTPTLAAVCVNSERREENHELLATSLLPPRSVLVGKYLAVLARTLLMTSALLPLTGLLYFYAGLDVARMCQDSLSLLCSLFGGAAVGLWMSNRVTSPAGALCSTFVLWFLIADFPVVVSANLPRTGLPEILPALAGLTNFINARPHSAHALFMLLITALFLALALARPAGGNFLEARGSRIGHYLEHRYRFRPIPEGANPFGYRDLYGATLAVPVVRLLVFVGVLIGYAACLALVYGGEVDKLLFFYGSERLLMMGLTPPFVAMLFVRERNPATMETYYMTLVGSSQFLTGKMLGLARLTLPIAGAIVLCKTLASAYFLAFIMPVVSSGQITSAWILFEPVLFPAHLILVTIAATLGAGGPRGLLSAVIGGYFSTAIFGFVGLLFTGVFLLPEHLDAFTGEAIGYLMVHLMLISGGSMTLWVIATIVVSSHWADNYADHRPEYYEMQQKYAGEADGP